MRSGHQPLYVAGTVDRIAADDGISVAWRIFALLRSLTYAFTAPYRAAHRQLERPPMCLGSLAGAG